MKIPSSPKIQSLWPGLVSQVGIVAIAAGILLLTGCYSLVAVPIGIGAIINSGDGFVGRHSKFWTDIEYQVQYALARDHRAVQESHPRNGCRLYAVAGITSKGTALPKGTTIRIDRIYRLSDGFNYEYIRYFAIITSGALEGNAIEITNILKPADSWGIKRCIDKRNLVPVQ